MMASKNYIIYKIVCDDLPGFVYVGSTCDFNERKRHHKDDSKNVTNKKYNFKLYTTVRENGGWENWRMIQIHQVPNITKREAEAIEEEYRLELNANLNTHRAFLFPEVRKELKSLRDKKYRESDKGKETYAKRGDCWTEINERPETKTRKHEHYIENREKYNAKAATRYVCNCGKELTLGKKARHEKTEFHLNYIKEQN
tara:strand:+ start:183 stop:779 length:597 start_codon:yes stop_codon:yes gene_type:complete